MKQLINMKKKAPKKKVVIGYDDGGEVSQEGVDKAGALLVSLTNTAAGLSKSDSTATVLRDTGQMTAAGASLGTMIAPGLGTAIGAGAGALVGLTTGTLKNKKRKKDEREKRDKTRDDVWEMVSELKRETTDEFSTKESKYNNATVGYDSVSGMAGGNFKFLAEGGEVKGAGTAKSDSIKTKVPDKSVIVPAENEGLAQALREMFLPKKEGTMKPGGDVNIKLSNGEHMFTPKEKAVVDKSLIAQGIEPMQIWDHLIPNPDAGNELKDGTKKVTADTTGTGAVVKTTETLVPLFSNSQQKDIDEATKVLTEQRKHLPRSQKPRVMANGGEAKGPLKYDRSKFRTKIKAAIEEAEKEKDPALRRQKLDSLIAMSKNKLLNSDESNYVAELYSKAGVEQMQASGKPYVKPTGPLDNVVKNLKIKEQLGKANAKRNVELTQKYLLDIKKKKTEIQSRFDKIKQDPGLFSQKENDLLTAQLKELTDLEKNSLQGKTGAGSKPLEGWNEKAAKALGVKLPEPITESTLESIKKSSAESIKELNSTKPTTHSNANSPLDPSKSAIPTVTLPDQSKAGTRTGRRTPKKTTPAPAPVTTAPVATASTLNSINPILAPERSTEDELKDQPNLIDNIQPTGNYKEPAAGTSGTTDPANPPDAKSSITAFDILSLGQMMTGLVSDPGRRPEDKPDPLLLSRTAEAIANADKAEEQAKSGFSQSQRESLVQGIENNRRQAMASTVQTSAGSGSASTALRGLSQDKNRALINIAAEDENLKLQKAGRADSLNQHANAMVAGVDARGRQIFEDDKDAYWKEATATGELINSGLFNYFQSQERKTIEEMRKKRELQNQG